MGRRRLLLTPRWAGSPDDDWYPWLAEQIGEPPVERLALPTADAPTIAGCVAAFSSALDAGDATATWCIGHSVSVQGWLHTLASRPGTRIAGLIAVAGWWTVDEPWPAIRPWLDAQLDLAAIRHACPRVVVLLGTDDPFTRDQVANAALFRKRLDAEVTVVAGAQHFNRRVEPTVLAAIERATATNVGTREDPVGSSGGAIIS